VNGDYFLFLLGINTGLRVSDIVVLRVKDVQGKDHMLLSEEKKRQAPPGLSQTDSNRCRGVYKGHGCRRLVIFPSRKGDGPISATQAYRTLVKAGAMIDRTDIGHAHDA
jgi:integrase